MVYFIFTKTKIIDSLDSNFEIEIDGKMSLNMLKEIIDSIEKVSGQDFLE